MKRIITGAICIMLLCFYTGCKKTETATISTDETGAKKQSTRPIDAITKQINEAKAFFNSNIPQRQASTITSNKTKITNRKQVSKTPLWEKSEIERTVDRGEAVVVPLKYSKPIHFKTSFGNSTLLLLDAQSKLYIYKDVKGNYKSEVVTTLPSKAFQNGDAKQFEGYLLTEDWYGNSINKKNMLPKKSARKQSKKVDNPESSSETARIICEKIDWYVCNENDGIYSNCHFFYTEYINCYDDGNNTTENELDNSDGSGSGGTSNTNEENENCLNLAVSEFNNEVNESKTTSEDRGSEIIDIDLFTKYKNPKWACLKGYGGWELLSEETGKIKLISQNPDKWAWVSLSHVEIKMDKSTLPGVSVTFTKGVGTPTFTDQTAASTVVLYGGMSLSFSVTYKFICNCPNIPLLNYLTDKTKDYTSTALWNAKPI